MGIPPMPPIPPTPPTPSVDAAASSSEVSTSGPEFCDGRACEEEEAPKAVVRKRRIDAGVIVRWRWILIGRWVFGRGMESCRGLWVAGGEGRPLAAGRGWTDMSAGGWEWSAKARRNEGELRVTCYDHMPPNSPRYQDSGFMHSHLLMIHTSHKSPLNGRPHQKSQA